MRDSITWKALGLLLHPAATKMQDSITWKPLSGLPLHLVEESVECGCPRPAFKQLPALRIIAPYTVQSRSSGADRPLHRASRPGLHFAVHTEYYSLHAPHDKLLAWRLPLDVCVCVCGCRHHATGLAQRRRPRRITQVPNGLLFRASAGVAIAETHKQAKAKATRRAQMPVRLHGEGGQGQRRADDWCWRRLLQEGGGGGAGLRSRLREGYVCMYVRSIVAGCCWGRPRSAVDGPSRRVRSNLGGFRIPLSSPPPFQKRDPPKNQCPSSFRASRPALAQAKARPKGQGQRPAVVGGICCSLLHCMSLATGNNERTTGFSAGT